MLVLPEGRLDEGRMCIILMEQRMESNLLSSDDVTILIWCILKETEIPSNLYVQYL